jgi:hypothetical protein
MCWIQAAQRSRRFNVERSIARAQSVGSPMSLPHKSHTVQALYWSNKRGQSVNGVTSHMPGGLLKSRLFIPFSRILETGSPS